jgi:hypothetical protein
MIKEVYLQLAKLNLINSRGARLENSSLMWAESAQAEVRL